MVWQINHDSPNVPAIWYTYAIMLWWLLRCYLEVPYVLLTKAIKLCTNTHGKLHYWNCSHYTIAYCYSITGRPGGWQLRSWYWSATKSWDVHYELPPYIWYTHCVYVLYVYVCIMCMCTLCMCIHVSCVVCIMSVSVCCVFLCICLCMYVCL